MILVLYIWTLFDLSYCQMTLIPLSIAVCNNLESASHMIGDGTLNECLSLCESRDPCNNLNYFTHLKHTSDSRCYLFNYTDNCILKSLDGDNGIYEVNQSFIYYKKLSELCVDYPAEWRDATVDDCLSYTTFGWCVDDSPDLTSHSFFDFDYFRGDVYGTSALQSCCNCEGGINYIDTIYWTSYYAEDHNITDNIICVPHGNLAISPVQWDEYTAYQLCLKYNELFLTTSLTQNVTMRNFSHDNLVAPCGVFIDINFKSDEYDELHIQVCKEDALNSILMSFEVDWNERQFFIFLNPDLFDATSFYANRYFASGDVCWHDTNITSYFGLMSCGVNPEPTRAPTQPPSRSPTQPPSVNPSRSPTNLPSRSPTEHPVLFPTKQPSQAPTASTQSPSKSPSTAAPTETCSQTASPVLDCKYYASNVYVDSQWINVLKPLDKCINEWWYSNGKEVSHGSYKYKCNEEGTEVEMYSYVALKCTGSATVTSSEINDFNCATASCSSTTIQHQLYNVSDCEDVNKNDKYYSYESHFVSSSSSSSASGCYYNPFDTSTILVECGQTLAGNGYVKLKTYHGKYGNSCSAFCQLSFVSFTRDDCTDYFSYVDKITSTTCDDGAQYFCVIHIYLYCLIVICGCFRF